MLKYLQYVDNHLSRYNDYFFVIVTLEIIRNSKLFGNLYYFVYQIFSKKREMTRLEVNDVLNDNKWEKVERMDKWMNEYAMRSLYL